MAAVARRNDVNANLLFDRRRKFRQQDRETRVFVPVDDDVRTEVLFHTRRTTDQRLVAR